jgi:hypothetical protein
VDPANRWEGPGTHLLGRLEWTLVLGGCVTALVAHAHAGEVRWLPFVALFAVIDLVGFLPGAVLADKATGRAPRVAHVAYNAMHSLPGLAAVAGLWSLVFGPEWALLALPIHLGADRGLLGNGFKPFDAPFLPRPSDAFSRFERELEREVEGKVVSRELSAATTKRRETVRVT